MYRRTVRKLTVADVFCGLSEYSRHDGTSKNTPTTYCGILDFKSVNALHRKIGQWTGIYAYYNPGKKVPMI